MKSIFFSLLSLFIVSSLFAQDSMESLLNMYKDESKLSNITKRESAGYLELYTRDELEKMQAHNLLDVLKVIPGLILAKNEIAVNGLGHLNTRMLPDAAIRLYINDHEMTSASYGSAFAIWSDMPLEYIDHIEVYKATSSIEFGNEVAALIVRVYTKQAQREEGSKIRLMGSENGGYDTNIYTAHQLDNGISYFAYGNKDDIESDTYYSYKNSKQYTIKDDKSSHTLFANITYDGWNLDLGTYNKFTDAYVGAGYYHTPTGGGIDSVHSYAHLSKEFDNNIKLQLSYDYIKQDGVFKDENYIPITDTTSPGTNLVTPNIPPNVWIVQDYEVSLKDTISAIILEKRFLTQKNNLLVGAFIKHKTFEDSAKLRSNVSHTPLGNTPYAVDVNNINNSLDLYSLYFEENYYYNQNTQFVVSMKGDFYRYDTGIPNKDEFIGRVGAIENIEKFQIKVFASHIYTPATFIELNPKLKTPRLANSNLRYPKQNLFTGSVRYKDDQDSIELSVITSESKHGIHYDIQQGYSNDENEYRFTTYQLSFKHNFDLSNKLYFDYNYGTTHGSKKKNPNEMVTLRLFNKYDKFDIYNELVYRNAYSYAGIDLDASYDYTASIKYHLNDDISVGVRGDNIFNSGYRNVYTGFEQTIPMIEQRFWLNVEVVF